MASRTLNLAPTLAQRVTMRAVARRWPLAVILTLLLSAAGYAAGGPGLRAVGMHLTTVVPAAVIAAGMLLMRKGTPTHRLFGSLWVVLMLATSLVSFFIRHDGLSAIHVLSVITLVALASGVQAAWRGNIRQHLICMIAVYIGSLIAGLFAVALPGRLLYPF